MVESEKCFYMGPPPQWSCSQPGKVAGSSPYRIPGVWQIVTAIDFFISFLYVTCTINLRKLFVGLVLLFLSYFLLPIICQLYIINTIFSETQTILRDGKFHAYPVDTGWCFGGMILRMSDYPRTLLEFQHLFPDETACARHLERIRWPMPPEWRRWPTGTFTKARRHIRILRNQTSLC